MNKILSPEKASQLSKELRAKGKSLVVAGGCFDILHVGHISFLKHAKRAGDVLFIMLEHDIAIKRKKGPHRPLNTQADRAEVLSNLTLVDYIILLPAMTADSAYDRLLNQLKPAIIATTAGDPYRMHKERQGREIGATVIDVIKPVTNQSTTRVLNILQEL